MRASSTARKWLEKVFRLALVALLAKLAWGVAPSLGEAAPWVWAAGALAGIGSLVLLRRSTRRSASHFFFLAFLAILLSWLAGSHRERIGQVLAAGLIGAIGALSGATLAGLGPFAPAPTGGKKRDRIVSAQIAALQASGIVICILVLCGFQWSTYVALILTALAAVLPVAFIPGEKT